MTTRLGQLLVALVLGSLLIGRVFLAVRYANAQPTLLASPDSPVGAVGVADHRTLAPG